MDNKKENQMNDNMDVNQELEANLEGNETTENEFLQTLEEDSADLGEESTDDIKDINSKEDISTLLEKEKQKAADIHDKYLRLYADFENFRRNKQIELREMIISSNKTLIADKIIPLFDDFERGLKASESSNDLEAVKQGLELIHHKFKNLLTDQGVKEIKCVGEEFNSEYHDALTKIPAPNPELKGKIIDEIEKGYMMGDKVIRFAKVVVGE